MLKIDRKNLITPNPKEEELSLDSVKSDWMLKNVEVA